MQTQPNEIKAIRILYLAMLAGQVIFALFATILVETGVVYIGNNSMLPLLQVALIAIAVLTISASFFVFRNRISDIQPEEELGKRLEKYRAALIFRMALCELPVVFASIAYILTSNRAFLWMIIILIGNFLFIYPARNKIIDILHLTSEEQSALGLNDQIP
jgi:hypothetical protein